MFLGRKSFSIYVAFAFTIAFVYYIALYRKIQLQELFYGLRDSEMTEACTCPNGTSAPRARATLNMEGLCQPVTTDRGSDQKVISYTVAGDIEDLNTVFRYFSQIDRIAQQIADIYPGWVMRIYHKFTSTDLAVDKYLCRTYCRYSHVDLCNVTDLELNSPSPVTSNVSKMHLSMWRFLPMADPTVSVFMSRDIDSLITQREAATVQDWLSNTSSTLQFLRDHPVHVRQILAGMWGARRNMEWDDELRTCFILIKNDSFNFGNNYAADEDVLRKWLYPTIGVVDAVRYHSYHCAENFTLTRPFPTQRKGSSVIGLPWHYGNVKVEKCPVECRPVEHQDWEYC